MLIVLLLLASFMQPRPSLPHPLPMLLPFRSDCNQHVGCRKGNNCTLVGQNNTSWQNPTAVIQSIITKHIYETNRHSFREPRNLARLHASTPLSKKTDKSFSFKHSPTATLPTNAHTTRPCKPRKTQINNNTQTLATAFGNGHSQKQKKRHL